MEAGMVSERWPWDLDEEDGVRISDGGYREAAVNVPFTQALTDHREIYKLPVYVQDKARPHSPWHNRAHPLPV